jgi:hypothetical protein
MTTGKIDFVNMPYYFDYYIAGCRSYYSKNAKNDNIISSILHGDSIVVVSQLDPLALRNLYYNCFLIFFLSLSLLLPRVIARIFVFLIIFLYSLFLVVWRPKLCSDIITLLLRLLLLPPPYSQPKKKMK